MKAANSFGKLGVPSPVTGSQPGAAENPAVPQPWLPPRTMSLRAEGLASVLCVSGASLEVETGSAQWKALTENGVDEADGGLAGIEASLVDEGEDAAYDGRRSRGAVEVVAESTQVGNYMYR